MQGSGATVDWLERQRVRMSKLESLLGKELKKYDRTVRLDDKSKSRGARGTRKGSANLRLISNSINSLARKLSKFRPDRVQQLMSAYA